MASDTAGNAVGSSSGGSAKNAKKANLLDHNSIKRLLDLTVSEIVKAKGYPEDVRLSNLRLLIGLLIISTAVLAQFYPKKFPENKSILISSIGLCILFHVILVISTHMKEKSVILFTHPPGGSFLGMGLVVSSMLPRFSDMYTLTLASADPKSILAKKPIRFTKSVTKWFTTDGFLVEGLLWKDVEKLIDDYSADRKTNSSLVEICT